MLGVNQGIILVLAVVVIGGLVGSGALGDMVAAACSATSSEREWWHRSRSSRSASRSIG